MIIFFKRTTKLIEVDHIIFTYDPLVTKAKITVLNRAPKVLPRSCYLFYIMFILFGWFFGVFWGGVGSGSLVLGVKGDCKFGKNPPKTGGAFRP